MIKNVYFDMDGVLANFDKGVEMFNHIDERPWLVIKDFYKNLEVIGNPNEVIETLQNLGYKVYLLSKVETRDEKGGERSEDKIFWAKKYLPSLPIQNIIIVPLHENKADYILTDIKESLLVDDYKENLKEWKALGGAIVKFGRVWKDERPYPQTTNLFDIIPIVESLRAV